MIQPMQHLWAPWRMEFIKAPKPSGCFFCEAASADPSDDPVRERFAGLCIKLGRAIDGVRDTETFVYLRMVKQTYQWGTR